LEKQKVDSCSLAITGSLDHAQEVPHNYCCLYCVRICRGLLSRTVYLYLSIYLSVCLSIYLSICLSTYGIHIVLLPWVALKLHAKN